MASADGQDVKKTRGQKIKEGCSNFGTFLYNRETRQVMGRSGRSWAKIGVFYVVFYSCLAGFFAAMMAVFLTTVNPAPVYNTDGSATGVGAGDKAGPKLTQYIENSPGLTRLVDKLPKTVDKDDPNTKETFTKAVKEHLTAVNSSGQYNTTALFANKYCNEANNYGLSNNKPCIFIKMNKVWGWVPEEDVILKCLDQNKETNKVKTIGLDGNVAGYAKEFFPYLGQKNFQYPAVAVKVDLEPGKKMTVQCKLEGKGIKVSDSYNPQRAYGKIEFEIGAK